MKPDIHTPPPVIVVGTGRCGSAMISSLLNCNPQVLSLSEFFRMQTDLGMRNARVFAAEVVSGREFAALLAEPGAHVMQMLRHGLHFDEVLYPLKAGQAYNAATGIPPMLMHCLPHLSSEHEALYREVLEFAGARPPAPNAAHFAALFDWLRLRFGRKLWVERSGGGLRMLPDLYRAFPQARFVHLVRDGRNCAISMHQHLAWRMQMLCMQLKHEFGFDPFAEDAAEITQFVPERWQGLVPKDFSADAFRAFQVPIPHCGIFWSNEIRAGLRALEQIPANQVLTLRYEDFLSAPAQTIARLAFFLDKDIVTVDWVRNAATKVRSCRSSWTNLDARGRAELAEACQPGFAALGDLYR